MRSRGRRALAPHFTHLAYGFFRPRAPWRNTLISPPHLQMRRSGPFLRFAIDQRPSACWGKRIDCPPRNRYTESIFTNPSQEGRRYANAQTLGQTHEPALDLHPESTPGRLTEEGMHLNRLPVKWELTRVTGIQRSSAAIRQSVVLGAWSGALGELHATPWGSHQIAATTDRRPSRV